MIEKAKTKIAILLLNDLIVEDFDSIVNALEFKKNVLVIANTKINTKKYDVQCMIDSLDNVESLLRKLQLYKSTHNIDFCGIVGTDEEYGYVFSESIAKEFKLEFNSKKTLDLVSNKYLQVSALKKGGVDVPDFRLVDTYTESKDFKLPCVIKPVRGISSIHVYKCDTDKDLKDIFVKLEEYKSKATLLSLTHSSNSDAKAVVQRLIDPSTKTLTEIDTSKHFVLEEFIDGNEYSCDFLVGKEVGKELILLRVVKKIVSKKYFPFFEGLCLFNPDNSNSEFSSNALVAVCKKIAKSLNIQTGLCMVDFRFDAKKKKIVVIETTTRPGVDDFMSLMYKNYGYISISIALRQIFGTINVNSLREIPRNSSIIIYLFIPRSGILKKFDISRLEKLRLKGVREIVKYDEVGDKVDYMGPLKNPPFVGHVIIDDIDTKDIEKIILQIRSSVDIELK